MLYSHLVISLLDMITIVLSPFLIWWSLHDSLLILYGVTQVIIGGGGGGGFAAGGAAAGGGGGGGEAAAATKEEEKKKEESEEEEGDFGFDLFG